MIRRISNSKDIEMVVVDAINIHGIDINALKNMISDSLLEKRFIIADINNGQMMAFMFATVETLDGKDVCFIQACHSAKDGSCQIMLDKCIKWAKGLGLDSMVFMTNRNPKAWERKYKFSKIYSVMQRDII